MKQRVITGAFIVLGLVIFIVLRQLNTYIFDVLIGAICVCSVFEVSKVLNSAKFYNNKYVALSFPVLFYVAFLVASLTKLSFDYFCLIIMGIILIEVTITLICAFVSKQKQETVAQNYVLKYVLFTTFLFVYPSLFLCNLFIINHCGEIAWFTNLVSNNLGLLLLIMLFAVTMFTDTFAYFVGSLLKGPKLCPKISPKKTISGAIGGLLGGVIASLLCFFLANLIPSINELFLSVNASWWQFLIYGIVGSFFSQCGDIYASLIKRKCATKDYSSVFPGHGGFMDRCDGLSFNVIVILVFASLLFV